MEVEQEKFSNDLLRANNELYMKTNNLLIQIRSTRNLLDITEQDIVMYSCYFIVFVLILCA